MLWEMDKSAAAVEKREMRGRGGGAKSKLYYSVQSQYSVTTLTFWKHYSYQEKAYSQTPTNLITAATYQIYPLLRNTGS
jgi:hypothetical protein